MLRRRWPLFVLGAVVLAATGLVFAALADRAPFRFLYGVEVDWFTVPVTLGQPPNMSQERSFYSLRATDEAVERARAELRTEGYAVTNTEHFFEEFKRGSTTVILYRDSRMTPSGIVVEKGWLLVALQGHHEPPFADRLKRLLGL